MVRTFGTKADQTYIIGGDSRSQDMFPIALCDIQLTPNESVPVNGFPTKERMLKYLYRPINFDSFMKDLGFSEEDINKLDDYWEEGRSNGVIGHLDTDLRFEVLNTKDFNSNTPYREILPNLRDKLPVIFPVKILNHNQNHGMLTPFLTTFDERKEYVKTVINKKGKRAEYSDEEKK